jgi:hypothetical protein
VINQERIKHLEILKKSYEVMLRSLQIRLDLHESRDPDDAALKNVLHDKISYYTQQIESLDLKIKNLE